MDGTNGLKGTTSTTALVASNTPVASTLLSVNVFTAPGKAMVGERPKPFGEALGFDPITSTLIFGEYDAALVDAMGTVAEAEALADWVRSAQPQPGDDLYNARPFRPLLRSEHSARPFPGRAADSNAQGCGGHAVVFHSHGRAVGPPNVSRASAHEARLTRALSGRHLHSRGPRIAHHRAGPHR